MSVLRLEGLRVAYGGQVVVRGFDLDLKAGETFGLVGESGCGKSTVALAIERHLPAGGEITGGRIVLDGTDITAMGEPGLRALRGPVMAMVYQDPVAALNPTMRIGAQLAEVAPDRAAVTHMLERVRLPDPQSIRRRYPHQLSGGQLQRVVIAMALLAQPRLLILDEPTTGLDVTIEAEVVSLISEIAAQEHIAILYISHDLGLIARVADRVGIMYAGRLVEQGSVRDMLRAAAHPYTRALLGSLPGGQGRGPGTPLKSIRGQVPPVGPLPPGCPFAPRCDFAVPDICEVGDAPDPVTLAPGHAACCRRLTAVLDAELPKATPPRDTPKETLLTLDEVSRRFGTGAGSVQAARDVSFSVPRAGITALVGESGSGKSTLARILVGLDRADSGAASFGTYDLATLDARKRPQALIRAVQMVFQNPDRTLNPAHRVGRILARALKRAGHGSDAAAVTRLLGTVRLPAEMAQRLPAALSGGQRQRVAIARAFAGRPELILADEPVSALDVSVQAAIVGLLEEMTREHGTAILLVSHDLMLVRHVADAVVVLYRGQVLQRGPAQAVLAPPFHPYTELLMASVHPPDPDHVAQMPDCPDDPEPAPEGLCPFLPRCHRRTLACHSTPPPLRSDGQGSAMLCHLTPEHLAEKGELHAP